MITFKAGYKYQLTKDYKVRVIILGEEFYHEFFSLDKTGILIIKNGYAWNGATWFPDFDSVLEASLVHDCLYQALVLNLLKSDYRLQADRMLKKIAKDNGLNPLLANLVYIGVRIFGKIVIKNFQNSEKTL